MTDNQPAQGGVPLPRGLIYYWIVVSVIAITGLILGVIGIYVNNRQDAVVAAENKVRDEQNKALLECFDDFARESSVSSTAVRAASVKKDAATVARDDSLDAEGRAFLVAIDHLLSDRVTPQDVQNLRDTLQARADAAARLDRAQRELDRVRKANPVPDPPSSFCATR